MKSQGSGSLRVQRNVRAIEAVPARTPHLGNDAEVRDPIRSRVVQELGEQGWKWCTPVSREGDNRPRERGASARPAEHPHDGLVLALHRSREVPARDRGARIPDVRQEVTRVRWGRAA